MGPDHADAVAGDTVLQSRVLEDLSAAVNYRRWLASLAAPHLGDDPIEIGSGSGDYAAEWLPGTGRITVTEGDPSRLDHLRQRFAGDPAVTVRRLMLPADGDAAHSAVVAYNVFEHIEDDVAALRSCARLLRPGGAVVVLVPAFDFAMSAFDREIGHQRRYRVRTLRQSLQRAGLRVETIRYVNPLGLLAWFVGMRLLRMRPKASPALRVWDGAVIPLARRIESLGRPPFGQSVFAVARRD